MKFVFMDRDGLVEQPPREFSSLKEFVEWTIEQGLPRFRFIPPGDKIPGTRARKNDTDCYLVWIMSSYD